LAFHRTITPDEKVTPIEIVTPFEGEAGLLILEQDVADETSGIVSLLGGAESEDEDE
jgi:hypothetical protein